MLLEPTAVPHVAQLPSRRTLAWRREDAGMLGCHLRMGEGLLLMGEGNGQCHAQWNQREETEGGWKRAGVTLRVT